MTPNLYLIVWKTINVKSKIYFTARADFREEFLIQDTIKNAYMQLIYIKEAVRILYTDFSKVMENVTSLYKLQTKLCNIVFEARS